MTLVVDKRVPVVLLMDKKSPTNPHVLVRLLLLLLLLRLQSWPLVHVLLLLGRLITSRATGRDSGWPTWADS